MWKKDLHLSKRFGLQISEWLSVLKWVNEMFLFNIINNGNVLFYIFLFPLTFYQKFCFLVGNYVFIYL